MILRRLYLYLVSAASLVVVAFGIAGLGSTFILFFLNDPEWQFSRTAIAGYGAAIIVGLPVWAIHMWIARRFALRDPAERGSAIRHLYFYWACLVFAIFFAVNLNNALALVLRPWLDTQTAPPPPSEGTRPILQSTWNALVLLVIWLLHYRMAARDRVAVGEQGASATLRRWYMYAALFIGFVLMLYSGATVMKLLWAKVLSSNLFQYDSLSAPVASVVTGFILWSFHARVVATRYIEDDRKSTLRAVEGFLAVVFSITLALYGGSQILYYSLARLLGVDNPGGLGNDILAGLADPGSKLIVFAPAWLLVRTRLSRDASTGEAKRQAAIRRLYVNLASLVSLAAMGFGAGQVLWTLAEQVEAPMIGVNAFDWKNPLSIGITLFAVGGAVWLAHWRHAPPSRLRRRARLLSAPAAAAAEPAPQRRGQPGLRALPGRAVCRALGGAIPLARDARRRQGASAGSAVRARRARRPTDRSAVGRNGAAVRNKANTCARTHRSGGHRVNRAGGDRPRRLAPPRRRPVPVECWRWHRGVPAQARRPLQDPRAVADRSG